MTHPTDQRAENTPMTDERAIREARKIQSS